MMITKRLILFILLILSIALKGQYFWEEIILPDSIENVYSVNFNSLNQVFLCTEEGIIISNDNGITWEFLAGFISSTIEISTTDEIYIGLDSQNRILYSESNGQEWDTIQTNFKLGGYIRLINDSLLFAFDWGWISKSTNGGYNWDTVLCTTSSEIFNDIIENQGVIFSGSLAFLNPQGGGINHSVDSGNSWEQISLPGYGVSSFALDKDNNLLCGINFQYDYLAFGVFRSFDNGYVWENILSGHIITSLAVDENGGIYAGCDSDFGPEGVMFSPDNGISWGPINSGLHEDASITSLSISPNGYVYTTTVSPSKIYRSINPIVEISELRSPEAILQLFPNPCQDVVNIRIESHSLWDKNQDYLIEIFNSMGEIVILEKMNNYEKTVISCDISTLAKGLYFVRIHSDMKMRAARFIKD